jgi:hypothetical protein
MLLWKPLVHGWRKQKPSLSINRAKVAHRQASVTIYWLRVFTTVQICL